MVDTVRLDGIVQEIVKGNRVDCAEVDPDRVASLDEGGCTTLMTYS